MLIGACVILASCSTAGISVGDYAAAMEERAAAYGAELDDLKDQQLATLEDTVARLQSELDGQALVDAAISETARESTKLFAGISDALDRYIRDLDAMSPPDTATDDHLAYIRVLETSRAGLGPVLADLPAASTFEEIDRVIAGSGFADAQQRVEAACRALEQAIEDEDATVDLRCEASR